MQFTRPFIISAFDVEKYGFDIAANCRNASIQLQNNLSTTGLGHSFLYFECCEYFSFYIFIVVN